MARVKNILIIVNARDGADAPNPRIPGLGENVAKSCFRVEVRFGKVPLTGFMFAGRYGRPAGRCNAVFTRTGPLDAFTAAGPDIGLA